MARASRSAQSPDQSPLLKFANWHKGHACRRSCWWVPLLNQPAFAQAPGCVKPPSTRPRRWQFTSPCGPLKAPVEVAAGRVDPRWRDRERAVALIHHQGTRDSRMATEPPTAARSPRKKLRRASRSSVAGHRGVRPQQAPQGPGRDKRQQWPGRRCGIEGAGCRPQLPAEQKGVLQRHTKALAQVAIGNWRCRCIEQDPPCCGSYRRRAGGSRWFYQRRWGRLRHMLTQAARSGNCRFAQECGSSGR